MSKKKSYMDRENVLSEGFFSKIIDKIAGKDKSLKSQLKKDKKLQKTITDMNDSIQTLEDYLNSLPKGDKVKLNKHSIGDFLK